MSCTRQPSMSCKRTTIPPNYLGRFSPTQARFLPLQVSSCSEGFNFFLHTLCQKDSFDQAYVNKFWTSKLLPYQHAFLCTTECFLKVLSFSFTPCVKRTMTKNQINNFGLQNINPIIIPIIQDDSEGFTLFPSSVLRNTLFHFWRFSFFPLHHASAIGIKLLWSNLQAQALTKVLFLFLHLQWSQAKL